jgi:hypothetical protein
VPTKLDPFQERPQNCLRLTAQRLFEEAHSAGGWPGAPGNASHLFDEALAQDAAKAVVSFFKHFGGCKTRWGKYRAPTGASYDFGTTFKSLTTFCLPATSSAKLATFFFSSLLRTTPFNVTWPSIATIFTLCA